MNDIPDCNTPDCERGYKEGHAACRNGRPLNSNPYDPDMELELYEGWLNGWVMAQQNDFSAG